MYWRSAPCAALNSSLEFPVWNSPSIQHTVAVMIEPAGTGFSAYVPDLPGCVDTALSSEAVLVAITPLPSSTWRAWPAMAW